MISKNAVINMRNRTTRLDHQGDYWTPDEKEQLKKLFEEGVGITEIALTLQRSEPAITQQIEKDDLYLRQDAPIRRKRTRMHNTSAIPVICVGLDQCPFITHDLPMEEDVEC